MNKENLTTRSVLLVKTTVISPSSSPKKNNKDVAEESPVIKPQSNKEEYILDGDDLM